MKNGFVMCIDWIENGRCFHTEVAPKDVIDNYKTSIRSNIKNSQDTICAKCGSTLVISNTEPLICAVCGSEIRQKLAGFYSKDNQK